MDSVYSKNTEEFGVSFAVREIQATPNPNAAKFILDGRVSESPTSFFSAGQALGHPLAARLFAISGVSNVMLLGDFITIGKRPEASWAEIKSKVASVLASS